MMEEKMSASGDTLSSGDPEVGQAEGGVAIGGEEGSEPETKANAGDAAAAAAVPARGGLLTQKKKKILLGIVAVVAMVVIAVAIAVPVTRRKRAQGNVSGAVDSNAPPVTVDEATTQVPTTTQVTTTEKPASTAATTEEPTTAPPTTANPGEDGGDGGEPVVSLATRFNAQLPSFSKEIMTPYQNCTALKNHILAALQQLADVAIDGNVERQCRWWGPAWGSVGGGGGDEIAETAMFDSVAQPQSATAADTNSGGESSYETNNQVDGVDEADVVKSNGTLVFAAYGAELVLLDTQGNEVSRITVPQPKEENTDQNDGNNQDIPQGAAEISFIEPSIGIGGPFGRSKPVRTIRSLLLENDSSTVTAITHYEKNDWSFGSPRKAVSGGVTTAYLYTFDTGSLVLAGSVDVNGTYTSARMIETVAHVVTNSYIDTYGFKDRFRRCTEEFYQMSDEEYENKVFAIATKHVMDYADQIIEELGIAEGESCSNVMQVSSMTDKGEGEKDDDDVTVTTGRRLDLTNGNGVIRSFMRIASIDLSLTARATLEDNVGVAGAFVPTTNAEIYANEDFLIIAGRGYRRHEEVEYYSWSEYTFLMSFSLQKDGSAAKQTAVGEVQGYLLNQFSMDYYDGFLRIATTNSDKWAVVELGNGQRKWEQVEDSSSQLTKLQFVNGQMIPVGQLGDLGVSERIFSARFIRDRAYIVTFELKDPLYVIDVAPDVPVVLGELEITGFSSYIHPIGDNDDLLLTVGQEADPESGTRLGFKISLFDVSDSSNPTEVQKYVAENREEGGGFSSSAAQWEHKAFRYLEQSQKLILPLSVWQWNNPGNFDGFVVYDVDRDEGIKPIGNVTHGNSDMINLPTDNYCFSPAYLPSRSMVFNGNLMTLKGHTVKISGDLDTLDEIRVLDLDENRNKETDICFDYFGPFW